LKGSNSWGARGVGGRTEGSAAELGGKFVLRESLSGLSGGGLPKRGESIGESWREREPKERDRSKKSYEK